VAGGGVQVKRTSCFLLFLLLLLICCIGCCCGGCALDKQQQFVVVVIIFIICSITVAVYDLKINVALAVDNLKRGERAAKAWTKRGV